jgi:hypothetical protein
VETKKQQKQHYYFYGKQRDQERGGTDTVTLEDGNKLNKLVSCKMATAGNEKNEEVIDEDESDTFDVEVAAEKSDTFDVKLVLVVVTVLLSLATLGTSFAAATLAKHQGS